MLCLQENPNAPPKSLDLSNELLSHGAIEALSDLLSVDFGLKKLTLESCGLDDEVRASFLAVWHKGKLTTARRTQSLKPLLHALLVSGSLPTLSLANNKRIKTKGWKLIAIFTRKVRLESQHLTLERRTDSTWPRMQARFLRYLDLSENSMDRKAADYLVQALTPFVSTSPTLSLDAPPQPAPAPTSPATDALPVSTSQNVQGLGISDDDSLAPPIAPEPHYLDDGHSDDDDPEPLFTVAPLLKDSASSSAATVLSIRLENCGLKSQALEALGALRVPLSVPH